MQNRHQEHTFTELLHRAVTEPGTVAECYRAFHGYSLGNQLLAMFACHNKGIPAGPLATYKGWQQRGRQVRKGEKAIALCVPNTYVKTDPDTGEKVARVANFSYKAQWFAIAQTDGDDYTPEPIGEFDTSRALESLGVTVMPFDMPDGNCQGYARKREIAISPIAQHPERTLLHELAHVLLGHTEKSDHQDTAELSRSIEELEAESTALLVSEALGLPGQDEARGYILHWFKGSEIPEANARRIINTASKILSAGGAS